MPAHIDLDILIPQTDTIACARCGESDVQRWGRCRGRVRYRCKVCGATFNERTNTPLSYSKRREQWPLFVDLMNEGATLRHAAVACGIHLSTAFRWRHTLLRELRSRSAPTLAGEIELAHLEFPLSFKGERDTVDARRRGWDLRHLLHVTMVHVVVLRSSDGGLRTLQSPDWVSIAELRKFALGRLDTDAVISGVERLARRNYCPRGNREVDEYERRLKAWLRGFRGVATRYLSDYLAWHRHRDGDVLGDTPAAQPWQRAHVSMRATRIATAQRIRS